jgi:hypothetical protein
LHNVVLSSFDQYLESNEIPAGKTGPPLSLVNNKGLLKTSLVNECEETVHLCIDYLIVLPHQYIALKSKVCDQLQVLRRVVGERTEINDHRLPPVGNLSVDDLVSKGRDNLGDQEVETVEGRAEVKVAAVGTSCEFYSANIRIKR